MAPDGASDPFWAPSGAEVAFFANDELKRVPIGGGGATVISEAGIGAGGTWNADGVIVFQPHQQGRLMRVAAAGGLPEPVTTLDATAGETHHLYPSFLPDGRHFVFYVAGAKRGLYAGELGSNERSFLFDPDPSLPAGAAATPGLYADSGHLLYVRDRVLMARRFDAVVARGDRRADQDRRHGGLQPAGPGGLRDCAHGAGLPAAAAPGAGIADVGSIAPATPCRKSPHPRRRFDNCRSRPTDASPPSSGATRKACRRCGQSTWRQVPRSACRPSTGAVRRCGAATDRCWPTASPPTRRRISSSVPMAEQPPNGASRSRPPCITRRGLRRMREPSSSADSRATPVGICSPLRPTAARRRSDCCKRRRTRAK